MVRQETRTGWAWPWHLVARGCIERPERRIQEGRAFVGQGPQWRQVLNHVGCTPKRPEHQVSFAFLDGHVPHRHRRHIVRPLAPVGAAVHTEVQPLFRAEEQQIRSLRILHHALGMGGNVLVVGQAFPRLAAVRGAVQVGGPIVAAVVVRHHVHLVRRMGADVNERNPRTRRQALQLGAVVRPRRTSVGGVLESSVVGAHPKLIGTRLGRRDAQNRAVVFSLGRVDGQSPARGLFQLGRIVGRQVRAQGLPRPSTVRTVVHALRTKVQTVPVVGVKRQGRVPRKPRHRGVRRGRLDVRRTQSGHVDAVDGAALVHGVQLSVTGGLHVEAIPKEHLLPILVPNASRVPNSRWTDP